ncbi:MAG: N-acetylmuramidase family protein [Desulfurellales bacterium]|nr:MAG: N-acetylmuramidase family protein [Desulfurellales bacterium]
MGTKLTEQDYEQAALDLLCDVPAIKAVVEVEAPRGGFLSDGRPVILFERHKFFQFTKGAYYATHPDICNPERGGYVGGAGEWARYERAAALDANAAALSASWGKFQIMGFNYERAGFATVGEFVAAMCESEQQHLQAFVAFIRAQGLDDDLRSRNWATFARIYNGPKYRENQYDEKMAAAYAKYVRQRPGTKDLRPRVTTPQQLPAPAIPTIDEDGAILAPPMTASGPIVSAPSDPPIQATQNGKRSLAITVLGWLTMVPGSVLSWLQGDPQTARLIVMALVLLTLFYLLRGLILDLRRIASAEHPGRYTAK